MSRLEEFRKRRTEIGVQYESNLESGNDWLVSFAETMGASLRLLFDALDTLIEVYENPTLKGD